MLFFISLNFRVNEHLLEHSVKIHSGILLGTDQNLYLTTHLDWKTSAFFLSQFKRYENHIHLATYLMVFIQF